MYRGSSDLVNIKHWIGFCPQNDVFPSAVFLFCTMNVTEFLPLSHPHMISYLSHVMWRYTARGADLQLFLQRNANVSMYLVITGPKYQQQRDRRGTIQFERKNHDKQSWTFQIVLMRLLPAERDPVSRLEAARHRREVFTLREGVHRHQLYVRPVDLAESRPHGVS